MNTQKQDAELVEQFEDTAILGMEHVRHFLTYEGDNPKYLQKAKIGAMAMSAYTRLRATRANERALVLAAQRITTTEPLKELEDGNS